MPRLVVPFSASSSEDGFIVDFDKLPFRMMAKVPKKPLDINIKN